jgi:hypothetical protein
MLNGRVLMAVLGLVVAGSACEGPMGEIDQSADAPLIAHLVARGYSPDRIKFDGDRVWVEGDAWMTRQGLEAELAVAASPSDDLVEKGYWRSGGTVPYAKQIGFQFAPNVPTYIRNAISAAASEWNGVTSCIGIGTHKQGPGTHFVQVGYVPEIRGGFAGSADVGYSSCRPDAPAVEQRNCARLGGSLTISEQVHPRNQVVGSYDDMIRTALHEIGHILGFKHPYAPENEKIHVTGTGWVKASCTGSGGTCKPAYPSVMDESNAPGGRELHLTADDLKTARYIYHPSRPTCTLP